MAANNRKKELHFTFNDEDFRAFGRYRIMYTDQGHKMVRQQRLTYIVSAIALAGLFTVFHVDKKFTFLMYAVAAVLLIVGIGFAETLVLRQQDKAINASANSADRVHANENVISFEDEAFSTRAGSDVQNFLYKDIKLVDLTEDAVYVWMSDTMIMPVPLRAFKNMDEMKEFCKWLREKSSGEEKAEEK